MSSEELDYKKMWNELKHHIMGRTSIRETEPDKDGFYRITQHSGAMRNVRDAMNSIENRERERQSKEQGAEKGQ